MKLVLAIFLFTCNISFVHPSCPENQNSVFCDGAYLIPQVYCGGVGYDDRWHCKKKQHVRCGCADGYAREKNDECVLVSQCEIAPYEYPITHYFKKNGDSGSKHSGPDKRGTGSNLSELGQKVLEFLQQNSDIYLVRISKELEKNGECVCLKSGFQANGVVEVERTLLCYKYVRSAAAVGSNAKVTSDQKLITITQYVEFSVISQDDQTRILLKYAIQPSTVTHLNEKQLHLSGEFIVLHAEEDCLIVGLARGNDEKGVCLLWKIFNNSEEHRNRCLPQLESLCTPNFLELDRHITDCKVHDASEKRAQELANKEVANQELTQ